MLTELWLLGYWSLLAAFFVSAGVAWLLVASSRWHLRHTDDRENHLPQKIHLGQVPRVGGLALALGVVAGGVTALNGLDQTLIGPRAFGLLAGALPVLFVGLAEDIFKRIRPRYRLLAAALGAGIAIQFAGIALANTQVPAIDAVFAIYGVAIAFTVFALVGSANAFNIIDGLNGLLGGVILITMTGIAVVAWQVGDIKVGLLAGVIAASTLGFLLFNWPRARLFAGDGGAYFLGFSTAALLLLLVSRNPTVSPWFGLTAAALPLFETVHSIWRRSRQRRATTDPDIGHLHQLLREWRLRARMLGALRTYRAARALPPAARPSRAQGFRSPNGSVAPWLWVLHAVPVTLGAIAWRDTPTQILLLVGFGFAYLALYKRFERFARHRSVIRYDLATGAVCGTHKAPCAPAPMPSATGGTAHRNPVAQPNPGSRAAPPAPKPVSGVAETAIPAKTVVDSTP